MVMANEGMKSLVFNLWPETGMMLQLSRPTTYKLASEGIIPTIRLGKRLLVPRVALERMLNEAGQSKAS